MKTFDGIEINIGDELYNVHGETFVIKELSPGKDEKLIPTPNVQILAVQNGDEQFDDAHIIATFRYKLQ